MNLRASTLRSATIVLTLASSAFAQANPAQPNPPQSDSATFDPDGTAHITRVIPMPSTISPDAQKWLQSLHQEKVAPANSLEEFRDRTEASRKTAAAKARSLYPVDVQETTIAGIRTDIIKPLVDGVKSVPSAPGATHRVLINLHGGGFIADSGSLVEGVPIANLSGIKVVTVYYRLAPENPYPAAVEDVVAVYKDLLKTYKPQNIGIYGTSAGAVLTTEVAVRLKQLGIPLPAALGIFSGLADYTRAGDSQQLFALYGLAGLTGPADADHLPNDLYVGKTDRKDPVLSPLFADLHGMPPSLLVTGTRDMLLSDTTILHRALLHAGNDAQLVVFEAMPHAFWHHFDFPETTEALKIMADFFDRKLAR
jgi:monoterpene epsilon-lactone hydrolase